MKSVQSPKSWAKRLLGALVAMTIVGAPVAGLVVPDSASAGTVTLTYNANGGPGCDAGFSLYGGSPFGYGGGCTGWPIGMQGGGSQFTSGMRIAWQTNAPPGIAINSASVALYDVTNVNNGQGWGGGSYFAGGGGGWHNGDAYEFDNSFSSGYWGFQMICGWAHCTNFGMIYANTITLTATENQGPSLIALGGNNLWYQSGRWVRNDSGDGGWPITLSSGDPSGVCNMWAYVNSHLIQGPAVAPNTGVWHQCPDQTWSQGAVVNTRDYITGAGQLNLALDAVNAAGVDSRVAETLNVDNDPVGVSLNTPNDADTTQWVGHPVTVDATASAGPSGVGGLVCSRDGGSNQSYPSGGVSVDGDGVHTVSCNVWNQAEGPNGSGATGTRSLAVRIDEAPPSTGFEPQNPGDPTGLVVDTGDSESGVAGGQIEMRPSAGGAWTPLPTQFDGQHLLAHFDDAGLNGPYQFQATACDNVGNCSATGQQLALPLRLASRSNVSFKKIVNPAQPRVVRERVRVGWHWAKVRRHGRLVRVKRGGHFKTIKVVKIVKHCTIKRIRIARRRWRTQRSCKIPTLHLKRTERVRYGHKVTLHGLLTTAQGIPLVGVPVQIMAAPDNGLAAFALAAAATTGPDGRWKASLPPGPSRLIEANYGGASTILPASGLAKVIVPAKVKLTSISPARLPWGKSVRISGRVLGGYVPASSKLLRLDIGVVGLSKIQGIPDIAPDGRFSVTYTFDPGRGVVRFWFMVSTLAEADFPFAPAHSRRLLVTVGVPTPPPTTAAAVRHHHRAHHRHGSHRRHKRRKR